MQSPSIRSYCCFADFTWEPAESNGSFAMGTLVAVDSCMPIDATNCLASSCQASAPDSADIKVLARSSLRVRLHDLDSFEVHTHKIQEMKCSTLESS